MFIQSKFGVYFKTLMTIIYFNSFFFFFIQRLKTYRENEFFFQYIYIFSIFRNTRKQLLGNCIRENKVNKRFANNVRNLYTKQSL